MEERNGMIIREKKIKINVKKGLKIIRKQRIKKKKIIKEVIRIKKKEKK